ncbi:hypothetical protein Tco_0585385 [Tanacetum coccineum]
MASFDYRLNPLYTIKECSSCGALYTTDYFCSKGGLVDKIVRDPNKTLDSSQRPPQNCARCGNPVDGLYYRGCALLRKKFKEDFLHIFLKMEIFQHLQDTFESSVDNTNVVNAPQEPFVVKQDPGENSLQSPPYIDHNYYRDPHETFQCQPMNYYEPNPCYDSNYSGSDQIQPPQYTINHPIFNAQNELLNFQNEIMEQMASICDMVGQYMQKKEEDKQIAEDQAAKDRYWKIPICYDDDDDEESSIPLKKNIISGLPPYVAITPVLSTEEPVDSLIMEDEHLDTIPATESDEVIKSSVKNLV